MAQAKLTKRFIDAAGPGEYRDSELTGFVLLVTPAGHKSFQVRYRLNGRKGTHTFGRVGVLTAEQARLRAQELLFDVSQGRDPSAAALAARRAWTVKELITEYERTHLPGLREATRKQYASHLRRFILPELRKLKVTEVEPATMQRLFRKVEAQCRRVVKGKETRSGKTTANRVLATASSVFGEAICLGLRSDNPCKAVKRNQEMKRERHLSEEETNRLLAECDRSPYANAANLIRLLIHTGARRGETLQAKWSEFDLERAIWTKPSHHTKQNRTHAVPLSGPAVALLKQMQEANSVKSPWAFPGADPERHVADPKRAVATIFQGAGIGDGATLHTLRHSFAALLVSTGQSLHITGRLMGHTQAATTHRYAHLSHDPQREALANAGASLQRARDKVAADEAKPSAELVDFAAEAARRHTRRK
jgi:integrase